MRASPSRLLVLLLSFAGATAFAQDTAQDTAQDAGKPADAAAAKPGDLSKDTNDEEDPANAVPIAKYLDTAQQSVETMRANLTRGLDQLKDAREKKDAVQLTCVNEQVTAMKGILRVSEDALVSLQEALTANDTERSRYEFRKIQVSKHKMDDLMQAAVNCAGAEASESNTSVEMEVDPSLSVVDPYYGDPSFFFDPSTTVINGTTGGLPQEDPPEVRPPPASNVT